MSVEIPAITRLHVYYCGWGERWLAGELMQVGEQLLFEYSREAIERGREFSPLQAPLPRAGAAGRSYAGPANFMGLPGFLADALPDGWGMLLMDRALRRMGRDPRQISVLQRLAAVGESAMGAWAFEPAEPLAQALPQNMTLAALARDVQAILHSDEETEHTTAEAQLQRLLLVGGSPQGARPKALLRWVEGKGASRFVADTPASPASVLQGESWLIKFPARGEHKEVCAIETLYARLARAGGMDMPEPRHFPLPGAHAAFGVRRFDREASATGEVRVPMLSLAALLHADYRLPALDYSTVLLATARLTGDYRETLKAFGRCVFNVLTHNRDDHAKNFAYLMDADGRWRLSPAFDMTFSYGPGGEHSTSVAGEGRTPGRRQLLQVAQQGGIKVKDAERVIEHWLDALQPAPHLMAELMADLPIRTSTARQMREALAPVWRAVEKG